MFVFLLILGFTLKSIVEGEKIQKLIINACCQN